MAISAFLVAFLLSASIPSVYGTEGGCLVENYVRITNTADTRILSLIKPDKALTFVVEFENHDMTFWRDWVNLTNSRVTHGKVRDGESSRTTHDLSLVVSEGWNNLRLEAVSASFELTQLLGDGDEATLLDLKLDFPVSYVHVMGTFSLCSEGSPEWKVAEGEVVSVPLQPERSHTLFVTGRGDAAPYILDSSSSSEPQKNISANTTLTIKTRWRRSLIQVEIFQNGTEEALADMKQPLASPTVQMGSRAGILHLRLDPSAPLQPATKDCHSKALWPMGFVLLFGGIALALGCLLGVPVGLLVSRQVARRATTSGAAATPSASKKLLPA
ncbi:uncharacterized protein LOC127004657 isoform X2 [Eriocheir sinensis]|uniref:uncharacterized protein LOC127004657 isoform X2 n=1 Tax=Eriocheir sinensis TaxID=95602 RepID=UPI0021C82431|nr:uncharacterized protein LOC127004657 isoform X2 [Eriocheir sinensis]